MVIAHGSYSWYSIWGRCGFPLIPPSLSAIFDCKKMIKLPGTPFMLSYSHIFLGLWTSDESWCFLGFHLVGKASTLGITKIAQKEPPFCSALSHRMCASEVQHECHSVILGMDWIHTEKFQCFAIRVLDLSECQTLCDFYLIRFVKENQPFYHLAFSLIPLSINFMQQMCQALALDIFLA